MRLASAWGVRGKTWYNHGLQTASMVQCVACKGRRLRVSRSI